MASYGNFPLERIAFLERRNNKEERFLNFFFIILLMKWALNLLLENATNFSLALWNLLNYHLSDTSKSNDMQQHYNLEHNHSLNCYFFFFLKLT